MRDVVPKIYKNTYREVRGVVAKRLRRAMGLQPHGREGESRFPPYIAWEENRSFPVDREKLASFRGIHEGERCFIVGNGPSLNETDLGKLANEITFGVNGIFYKTRETGFVPTYYVVEDIHVVRDNLPDIQSYRGPRQKFFPSIYRELIGPAEDTSYFLMNRGFYEERGPNFRIPRFSSDITDKIYCGQSVTYINLQLAYYMGFSKVYLIGVDFSYTIPDSAKVSGFDIESTEDDPNHFHPEYFGKGKKWHDPQLEQVKKCYEFAKLVYGWRGGEVLNATKGGMLEVFERVSYDDLFERPKKPTPKTPEAKQEEAPRKSAAPAAPQPSPKKAGKGSKKGAPKKSSAKKSPPKKPTTKKKTPSKKQRG